MRQSPTPDQRRFRIALELHELGVAMMRQRLSMEQPQASSEELDRLVRDWLGAPRTGAHGGRFFREIQWPRSGD